MKLIESLQHQPVELPFGTSGLRGRVVDMTDLECYINAAGFLQYLVKEDGLKPGETVYIAGDLRDSTPRIMRAVAAAITDGGYCPINCGKIPTPALAYYALQHNSPCIMVSGSHIPADRNGIKFYKRAGEVMKHDEPGIQAAVRQVRDELYAERLDVSQFDDSGSMKSLPELGAVNAEAEEFYKRRYLDVFPADALAGANVVVYQQSAVVRDILVEILTNLGATVTPIERSEVFVPIDTDKITPEEKERFRTFAERYPGSFAIVSADGDSDRPIVIDEKGEFHWGDLLGCLVAEFLGIRFAATVVCANDAVDMACAAHDITLTKTKIGSPHVIAAMSAAPPDRHPAAAWELNGGFLLGDDVSVNGKLIKRLVTRDAMLPTLVCLVSAHQQQCTVSDLFAKLPRRFTGADLVDGVPEASIAAFRAKSTDVQAMTKLANKLFAKEGLGSVANIDVTDGVRIRFSSGDVLHFRPSGNAPQFRIYTNASSQERADELVRDALRPNGYIARILQEVI